MNASVVDQYTPAKPSKLKDLQSSVKSATDGDSSGPLRS